MDTSPFEAGLDKMAKMFDKYTKPIKDLAKSVWGAISGFAVEEFNKISAWWAENGAQISEGFSNAWNAIKPVVMWLVEFIWGSIKGLINGVITFFMGLIDFFTGVFTGDWGMAWEGIKEMFFGAIQAIWNFTNLTLVGGLKKLFFSLVKDGLKIFLDFGKNAVSLFSKTWKDILKFFTDFIKATKQFFTDFGTWFEQRAVAIGHGVITAFEKIGAVGKTIWNAIKSAFTGAVDWFVRSIITPIQNRFESIKDAFHEGFGSGLKAVLNAVRSPINYMIDGLNNIKNAIPLAKKLPNIPRIPHLAEGGITNGPSLALVGDNRGGQEVISPLDRLQGIIGNTIAQVLQMNGAIGGRGNGGDIILNIDGRAFARIVKPFLEREDNRAGTDIRIRTI
jgi:phage-related protein